MKLRLVAVGKVKEKYFTEAINEYSKRLSGYCDFSIVEVKEENYKNPSQAEIKKILAIEGERIEKAVKGYVIVLAIEGKKITSEEFAQKIKTLTDRGEGEITFVIGGSYGVDERIKCLAKEKVSFSGMTFPHTLMRVITAEQLYRAFSINAGSEYHK
ncbi:MAG: 23S rRNA (pseudouridine(1915)-N(3))-methyltransferase RlmH [Clostridiales bacterium]|nr:23S rRNA (pseudouridine(1915)-N(3))-methyltransferase RlmH [Clostridiales bacterium]